MSDPDDPTENWDERLDLLRDVLDHNEQSLVAQTQLEDADQLYEGLQSGEEVTLTIDMADLVTILGLLEQSYTDPPSALHLIQDLDLFIRLQEEHEEELAEYVDQSNAEMEDLTDTDPEGMYQ